VEGRASSQQTTRVAVSGQVEEQEAAFRLVAAVPWAQVVEAVVQKLVGEAEVGRAAGQEG